MLPLKRVLRLRKLLLWGLPLLLLLLCWQSRPFSRELLRRQASLSVLSPAQRANVSLAARYLDGVVLEPGQTWSFNRTLGPRTIERGYRLALSYLADASPATPGGGICLLSSLVYQVGLESGLTIVRRVPHLRTIHSVPAGLDATVWYGGADLEIRNTLNAPVQLRAQVTENALQIRLTGKTRIRPVSIHRTVQRRNAGQLLVTVFRGNEMVSRDLYGVSP